jgi:hypothetical protein
MMPMSGGTYVGLELSRALIPSDSLEARCVVSIGPAIRTILQCRRDPQVAPAVVQPVSVYVVNFLADDRQFVSLCNETVHIKTTLPANCSL